MLLLAIFVRFYRDLEVHHKRHSRFSVSFLSQEWNYGLVF